MKIKISEATPLQINWAVAKCEGLRTYVEVVEGFKPSTDWMQGGPIIQRENICLWTEGYDWEAKQYGVWEEWGPTPLIAAMRCYVGSKLGNEVEIPEGLQ